MVEPTELGTYEINSVYISKNQSRINNIISKIILSRYNPLKVFHNFENINEILPNLDNFDIIFVKLDLNNETIERSWNSILGNSDGIMSIKAKEDLIVYSNESIRLLEIKKDKELNLLFLFPLMRFSHLSFSHSNIEIICFFLSPDLLECLRCDLTYISYPLIFHNSKVSSLSKEILAKKKILEFYKGRKEKIKILQRIRISKRFYEINEAIRYLPYIGICRRRESKEIRRELKLLKN